MHPLLIISFLTLLLTSGCSSMKTLENRSSYPLEEGFISVPGEKLYYQRLGKLGKGTPIIVIHGGPGMDQSYLLPQMLELAKDHEVIFYDQRGSGKSSTQPLDKSQLNINRFVKDLAAVRNYFGFQQVVLLGHSWGTLLAAEYAIKCPQHISKLILLNSVPLTSEGFQQFEKEYARRMTSIQKPLEQMQSSKKLQEADPEATAAFYQLMFSKYCFKPNNAEKITLHFTKISAANTSKVEEVFTKNFLTKPYDLRPQLRKLTTPTLIIHGAKDPVPLSTAEEIDQALPYSTIFILKNCGHFSYIEQQKKCFEAIRKFLNSFE